MTTLVGRAGGRRSLAAALAVVLVALATAGCLGSIGPSPGTSSAGPAVLSSDEPSPEATPAESSGAPATATPGPTKVPSQSSGRPDAALVGPADGPVAGVLGTFSWNGLVSRLALDRPVDGGGAQPGPAPARPVRRRPAGRGVDREMGACPGRRGRQPVKGRFRRRQAPGDRGATRSGDWSLQVEARFGGGGRAVWYWRVKVDR